MAGFGHIIALDELYLGLAQLALVALSVRIARKIARTSADELALAWKLEVGFALLVLAIALTVCTVFVQRSFGSPGVLGWVAQAFTMIPFSMATFYLSRG